jgi:SAM-dependent methyltransferase
MEYSKAFARYYDLIYDQIRAGIDHRFYLDAIAEVQGKILEIGCGTGRLMSAALARGADMYGIDVSEPMLNRFKKKLKPSETDRISRQSASDFSFDEKFGLIIAPFRVFSHLISVEEQITCLENVAGHLEEDGRFIFDVFIPDPGMLAEGLSRHMDFEGVDEKGKQFRRYVTTKSCIVTQTTEVFWELEWETDHGWESESWKMPFRYFFRYELEHLIARSPLQLRQCYGDFELNPLRTDSKEFIIICNHSD